MQNNLLSHNVGGVGGEKQIFTLILYIQNFIRATQLYIFDTVALFSTFYIKI